VSLASVFCRFWNRCRLVHKERVEAGQNRLREIERQRIRAEADRQHREQEEQTKQLKDWAKALAEAESLREFLSARERYAGREGAIKLSSQADGFGRWEAMVIDEIDPVLKNSG
jgi:hypothetical protein